MRSAARFPVALAGLVLVAGCGWQTGLGAPAETVGVEWFDNQSPEPGVDVDLTRELSRAVADLVDARLVEPGHAAVVVEGTVEAFRRRRGVRNRENGLLETGVRIDASARLVDASTGAVLSKARANVWAGFAVDDATNDARARERAVRKVADELVLDLFATAAETSAEDAASEPDEEGPPSD